MYGVEKGVTGVTTRIHWAFLGVTKGVTLVLQGVTTIICINYIERNSMIILVDTREKKNAHVIKHFDEQKIDWVPMKLDVGDYMIAGAPELSIDKKSGLEEVYGNLIHDHDRFVGELVRARTTKTHLVVLIEEPRIKTLDAVKTWHSWREKEWQRLRRAGQKGDFARHNLNPNRPPMNGSALYYRMEVLADMYGVEWRFCRRQHTGEVILSILAGDGGALEERL